MGAAGISHDYPGLIANEIFRRIEPSGRTMGEFLRAEISQPLGVEVYFDLNADQAHNLCRVKARKLVPQLLDSIVPGSQARRIGLTPQELFARGRRILPAVRRPVFLKTNPLMKEEGFGVFDSAGWLQAQTPSAGAKCSARGLAKLAAVIANGGSALGNQLLTESGCAALHAEPIERKMTIMDNRFTQAGLALFDDADGAKGPLEAGMNCGRDGFYGWMGLGGSVFQWHPQKRIGFAYVPTALNPIDLFNERINRIKRSSFCLEDAPRLGFFSGSVQPGCRLLNEMEASCERPHDLKPHVRTVKDYPIAGVEFRDITSLPCDARGLCDRLPQ